VSIVNVDIGLVSSGEALVDFYVASLGAQRLDPRVFPFGTVHRLACGPVTLKIMVPQDRPAQATVTEPFWAVSGLRYVTLWVDELAELTRRWVDAGGAISMAPTEIRPGVVTAVLLDPDHNVVEVMESRPG
jgi:Glyoxalase/Bleomycin resistance protein/Dioxygenase superfamily